MSADQVIPGLFVGPEDEVDGFEGHVLCVLEGTGHFGGRIHREKYKQRCIPIIDRTRLRADASLLGLCGQIIDEVLKSEEPILVHCAAGIERSPLTVAWYLVNWQGMCRDEAYAAIRQVRPRVIDRWGWIRTMLSDG